MINGKIIKVCGMREAENLRPVCFQLLAYRIL